MPKNPHNILCFVYLYATFHVNYSWTLVDCTISIRKWSRYIRNGVESTTVVDSNCKTSFGCYRVEPTTWFERTTWFKPTTMAMFHRKCNICLHRTTLSWVFMCLDLRMSRHGSDFQRCGRIDTPAHSFPFISLYQFPCDMSSSTFFAVYLFTRSVSSVYDCFYNDWQA